MFSNDDLTESQLVWMFAFICLPSLKSSNLEPSKNI